MNINKSPHNIIYILHSLPSAFRSYSDTGTKTGQVTNKIISRE